ncbi:PREDICTED: protein downstream neighbor of Son-like [Brassica oleracea var. oleracea]|uniref:Protein downstream neighbor of Son-like n=1 Tax=Brassica oleracea var. oleracea TaxID=109376 RepID=A0A0D3DT33_BRAOL|nr:PREDICTED: protein downstream neighbor of Son-like [Brassica oleracea var. oleracea]XP_013602179.1 PREDICTED: protein downstream neighbor of Son-like [Brassica oleracea var. oleracea]XP_013602180.1 PREDICTED: protein downstream neighbor of Son-like [Brassica oleracea var. oleracea]XP_013602182.1 PREDICTED: protein downstream neighbor of Son-like [Brassica oleracea var. oleracea]
MAKVVAPGAFGTSLQMSGGSKAKRKTPAELRGEQLKRTSFVDQAKDSFDALRPCKSIEREYGFKKQEHLKNPKYIDMRMDELYPVKKARPWIQSGKDISKEIGVKEQSSNLFNVSLLSNVAAIKRQQLVREDSNASTEVSNGTSTEARQTNECRFRSVTELSTRSEELSYLPDIDMSKALKGLATCVPLPVHPDDISGKSNTASLSGNFVYEFHIPGREIPLDFSMKTYVRLVSSSPLNWLHRSIMGSTYNGMPQLNSLSCNVVNQDNSSGSGSAVVSQVLNSMSLHSWVYPQSTLPPCIISALLTSGPDRGEGDFLQKRRLAWEDAFRSLYFMFRKNLCKIFYVCTSQFVAMFTGSCESGGVKRKCNAYITQSTRRLRAMLKDLDICYTMPLCKTKIDETTVEDLAELSEIENHNLGQARRLRSVSNIDNTPESFLAFEGNESVHGVYDLLLNYRSSLGFLLTSDVPVLYSPVPFQNAAVSSPEIKCTEMVKTDDTSCCLVEVKGEYLPPWIISNICANVGANGQNFEASFVTEPTSVSLNMGLPQIPEKTEPETSVTEGTGETKDGASGIPGAVICPQLQAGYLKSLKYCNNLNTVSVSLSPS